jgi:hypothetical protein
MAGQMHYTLLLAGPGGFSAFAALTTWYGRGPGR